MQNCVFDLEQEFTLRQDFGSASKNKNSIVSFLQSEFPDNIFMALFYFLFDGLFNLFINYNQDKTILKNL